VGGGFLAVSVVLLLTLGSLVEQAPEVADATTSGAGSLNDALGGHLGIATDAVASGALESLRALASVADAAASVIAVTILSTLLAFYFLRDGGQLWRRVTARLRPESMADVTSAGGRAFDVLSGYMIGTAAISFVGAASQFVIMVLLGLPLALPVFVLSFLLCFIPYIGSFLSTGIAFLIAIAVGSTADIVIMGIWTLVFNIVQGNIVSPIVYGRTVHIHPAIVLVAIPAGAAIAGILGMFIVVPALGIVAATWRTVLAVMAADGERAIPAADAVPTPMPAAAAPAALADTG
jgi:predicted PurR-regulated permease PerM